MPRQHIGEPTATVQGLGYFSKRIPISDVMR